MDAFFKCFESPNSNVVRVTGTKEYLLETKIFYRVQNCIDGKNWTPADNDDL